MLFHPFTGEVIDPDDLEALERAEGDLTKYLSDLGVLYGVRRELRTAISERRKAARLPRPRLRTEVQQRVAECPRCGGRHGPMPFSEGAVPTGQGAETNPFHDGEAPARGT